MVQLEIVKYLVGKGASVQAEDNFGRQLLHSAIDKDRLEIVKYLVAKEASVQAEQVIMASDRFTLRVGGVIKRYSSTSWKKERVWRRIDK